MSTVGEYGSVSWNKLLCLITYTYISISSGLSQLLAPASKGFYPLNIANCMCIKKIYIRFQNIPIFWLPSHFTELLGNDNLS